MSSTDPQVHNQQVHSQSTSLQFKFVTRLSKHFQLDVDLALPAQGITTLFGHSGSGKTTLLRCIAGLHKADHTQLLVNDEVWASDTLNLPPHQRAVGYVFQEPSLFPHLSVKANLEYAVKRAWQPVTRDFYDQVIEVLGIDALLSRQPDNLSGGEKQRVAIARALLIRPKIMLMDEPLASLDYARKQEILPYLETLKSHFDIPIIYVSHALDEVVRLADYSVLLDQGSAIAQGKPAEVFARIDLPHFFHDQAGAIIEGKVSAKDPQWHLLKISFSGGELWLKDAGESVGDPVRIRILARDVSLTQQPNPNSSILNTIKVKILQIANDNDPAMALLQLQAGQDLLVARMTHRSVHQLALQAGQSSWAQLKSVAIVK